MLRRMGMAIAVHSEKISEYRRLHAEPWPEMNQALNDANIHKYSTYIREPENLLFGYWEYACTAFDADMKILEGKAVTKRWPALTDPCQTPLGSAATREWWSTMPEIYHLDKCWWRWQRPDLYRDIHDPKRSANEGPCERMGWIAKPVDNI